MQLGLNGLNTSGRNHLWPLRWGRTLSQSIFFGLTKPLENSDTTVPQPRTDEIDQRPNVNPDVQPSSESFAFDGLDGGISDFPFPGADNREQAGTLQQGAVGNHGIMSNGQDTPAPIHPPSLPSSDTEVDAIGDNSPIR